MSHTISERRPPVRRRAEPRTTDRDRPRNDLSKIRKAAGKNKFIRRIPTKRRRRAPRKRDRRGRHHGGRRENRCRLSAVVRKPNPAAYNRSRLQIAARRTQPKPTNRESNPAAYNRSHPRTASRRIQPPPPANRSLPRTTTTREPQAAATTAAARDLPQPPLPGRNDLRFDRRARFLRHRRIFSVYLFVQTPYPCPALPYRPPSPHRSRTRS